MIIWGSGGKAIDLGIIGTEACATCDRSRVFHLLLRYRYAHVYWIFKAITEKKYLKLCEVCSRGWELDKKKTEDALTQVPIPFMDRFGWLVGIAVVAVITLIGILSGK